MPSTASTLEMDAYNHNIPQCAATWYCSANNVSSPYQTYSGVFSIQSYKASNNPYMGLYVQPSSSSGKYPGVLQFTTTYGCRLQQGNGSWVTLPGGIPAIYPSFYQFEWQLDYQSGMQRARFGPYGGWYFGPYGGTLNIWSAWVPMRNQDQLDRVVFGCYSYVDLDDVSLKGSVSGSGYGAWVEHSAVKVFQTDGPLSGSQTSASLHAAKGEAESFQLVLRGGTTTVTNITVSVSDLTSSTGKTISASNITLYKECYLQTPAGWPDPLPPLTPFDLAATTTQPIWVLVRVPGNCSAGDYNGTITVLNSGSNPCSLPVSIHVWNFSLPVTPKCITAMDMSMPYVAAKHGVAYPSDAAYTLQKAYYEFLLDHKISCYYIPPFTESPAQYYTAEALGYLQDPRMTAYRMPYLYPDRWTQGYLQGYLQTNNSYAKGYYYTVDEPYSQTKYDQIKADTTWIKNIDPNYRYISPFNQDPDQTWMPGYTPYMLDDTVGRLNIWCPREDFLDTEPRATSQQAARKALGDETWWYICNAPRSPYANLDVDFSAMQHRMLFWLQKMENCDGFLVPGTPHTGCM